MTQTETPPAAAGWPLLKRLLRDKVRPHWPRLAAAMACMTVVAMATALNAWLMKPALDGVLVAQDRTLLWLVPLAIILVALVKGVAGFGETMLMNQVGQRIIADTQVELFAHLMRADLGWLHKVHSGKLVSSFLFDATLLREAVSKALAGIVKETLTLALLFGVMLWRDLQLAAIFVLVFPVVAFATRNVGRRTRKGSTATQEETGKLTAILSETFEGARLVKAYGMEDRETERARRSVERRLQHIMRVVRARAAAAPITEAVGAIMVALAFLYGGWRIGQGEMTAGDFASFITALLLAYQPMKSLANLHPALQEGLAAAQRLFAVLDVEPRIRDREGALPLAVSGGAIRFEDVHFSYGEGAPALGGVSFAVAPGRKVALVGASGAGKSTILNLIPRFYDASAGQVLIDGQDVREVTLTSLREAIAVVSQEATLFDDTVRANIAYGRPGSEQRAIEAAAQAAAAHDFIMRLPQGYDTMVGENGVALSGGQRQRIAIARAMLRNAPILLLDEATSALDAEAERKVQLALRRLMQGRTTLVIAHRLSTVMDADEIHVIEAGRVVESGRHAELMAEGGRYARLYATQFSDHATARPAAAAPARAR